MTTTWRNGAPRQKLQHRVPMHHHGITRLTPKDTSWHACNAYLDGIIQLEFIKVEDGLMVLHLKPKVEKGYLQRRTLMWNISMTYLPSVGLVPCTHGYMIPACKTHRFHITALLAIAGRYVFFTLSYTGCSYKVACRGMRQFRLLFPLPPSPPGTRFIVSLRTVWETTLLTRFAMLVGNKRT